MEEVAREVEAPRPVGASVAASGSCPPAAGSGPGPAA